jgi:glycosyltransferase involved in cell wall biosynthesis
MVTIITVVYNGEKTIRDTIESVCRQTVLPQEYLIIDGLSTDGTMQIVKEYAANYPFIKFVSEQDNGIYDAMNKGISMAAGELIGIINSDDWYELSAVEMMLESYKSKGAGVHYGILRYFLDEREYYLERISKGFVSQKMIPHPATFVSSDIYKNYGAFSLQYRYSSDLEFVLRLAKQQVSFFTLDVIIANFRIGGISSNDKARIEALKVRKAYGQVTNKQFLIQVAILKIKKVLRGE